MITHGNGVLTRQMLRCIWYALLPGHSHLLVVEHIRTVWVLCRRTGWLGETFGKWILPQIRRHRRIERTLSLRLELSSGRIVIATLLLMGKIQEIFEWQRVKERDKSAFNWSKIGFLIEQEPNSAFHLPATVHLAWDSVAVARISEIADLTYSIAFAVSEVDSVVFAVAEFGCPEKIVAVVISVEKNKFRLKIVCKWMKWSYNISSWKRLICFSHGNCLSKANSSKFS